MLNFICCLLLSFSSSDTVVNSSHVVVSEIKITGNKKTKASIVTRELTFKQGDTISKNVLDSKIKESQQNVMNTALFNFVFIHKNYADSSHVLITIDLKEAWYTWPTPIFEIYSRNFNEWWATKDLYRVSYGMYLSQYNVRGRNETVSIGFRHGYTQSYFLNYTVPYINKKQNQGMGFSISYSRNHEIAYDNKWNTVLFHRVENRYAREQFETSIKWNYRKGYYISHNAGLGYKKFIIDDEVLRLNPEYFPRLQKEIQNLYCYYILKFDYRNFRPYPLKGYFMQYEIQKMGLGIVSNDVNAVYLIADLRRYVQLYKRFYFATGVVFKSTINPQPSYYTQIALGYTDFLRGYEYYVIGGQHYGLAQSNFKYNILKPRVDTLKFIPSEKFNTIPSAMYLNLFFDVGYSKDDYFYAQNPMVNELQYSFGLGLDYTTYYSTVLRLDYSINKFGEKGFFLHFTIPI